MKREEFAKFLGELKIVNDKGQDTDAFIKKYEHRNVYFYNDGCIKKILASEKNLILTTDLVNAALNLIGSDRIVHSGRTRVPQYRNGHYVNERPR